MGQKKKQHDRQRKQRDQEEIQRAEKEQEAQEQQQEQEQQEKKDKKKHKHNKKEEKQQNEKQQIAGQKDQQKKFEIVPPKKVSYCPACSLPFQLCRYGKNPNACIKVLYDLAPTKVVKYHPEFKEQDIVAIKKQIKDAKKQQAAKQDKKQKTVKDKYVVIDTKNRGKHKYVTTISGLGIFNVDAKEFAKKLSKKFACSCSAIQEGVAQVQGQFFEQIKQILIMQYKVKKKYILDGQQYKVKFNEQMQKRKQQRKMKTNQIKQADEKDEVDLEIERQEAAQKKKAQELAKIQEKPKTRVGFQIRSDSQDDD